MSIKFKFLPGLILTLLASGTAIAQNEYGLPSEIKDSNILHCFDWKLTDITKALPDIAEAGFGAIQISPMQSNVPTGRNWSDLYRPYDFTLADKQNGLGTPANLTTLCQEAEKYGIKIIVDVVFNHVDNKGYHDTWWDSNGRLRSTTNGVNYSNRYSITHDRIGDYPEVNSEQTEVISRAKAYIEQLKGYGVKGIRFDAAKHIALPSEGCNFWKEVTSVEGMFYYGEILSTPGGSDATNLMKEYTQYMYVTDDDYSSRARNNAGVPPAAGNWSTKGIDASKLVYWGESHDTYSNDPSYGGVTKSVSQGAIDKAYAILGCRQNGLALYFSRPSAKDFGSIKVGQKGSTHFMDREVAEVNKFKNAMVGKAEAYTTGGNAGVITRQGGGAVIVNKTGTGTISVPNAQGYCPVGTYYDRISGNEFTVTAETITGKAGATGIVVIYGDFKPDDNFGGNEENPSSVYIYCTNPSAWDNVYVYMYSSGGALFTNGKWPGVQMTRKGDIWEYEVPEELWYNSRVIFNNGINTDQYPEDVQGQESGFELNGKTMISEGREDWKEYDNSNTGINDTISDDKFDPETAKWFTINGIQVVRPTERGLYIAVTPKGQTKKILVN